MENAPIKISPTILNLRFKNMKGRKLSQSSVRVEVKGYLLTLNNKIHWTWRGGRFLLTMGHNPSQSRILFGRRSSRKDHWRAYQLTRSTSQWGRFRKPYYITVARSKRSATSSESSREILEASIYPIEHLLNRSKRSLRLIPKYKSRSGMTFRS